jgi:hypothetical protein
MSQFYDTITEMLAHQQMSISRIARELKKSGYDQHRLILTGYLRALHDTGSLEEIDIPPSKVYTLKTTLKKNIYSVVKERLRDIDASERLEVAVFILSSLFRRPCFKSELELLGIEPKKSGSVRESKDERLKEHRAAVTRIKIAHNEPAFELNGDSKDVLVKGNEILAGIINELIDLDGLKAKYQQTKLAWD